MKKYPNSIPLFAIDGNDRLHLFLADATLAPKTGWQVHALHPAGKNNAPAG